MTAPTLSPPLTMGIAMTGPVPVRSRKCDRVRPPGLVRVQVADVDLAGVNSATAWRVSDDNRLLDTRVTVDDAQPTRVKQADHDPLRTEQVGDMGQQSGIKDFRLLDAATQTIVGHALPCRQELSELIDLVPQRDARGSLV